MNKYCVQIRCIEGENMGATQSLKIESVNKELAIAQALLSMPYGWEVTDVEQSD